MGVDFVGYPYTHKLTSPLKFNKLMNRPVLYCSKPVTHKITSPWTSTILTIHEHWTLNNDSPVSPEKKPQQIFIENEYYITYKTLISPTSDDQLCSYTAPRVVKSSASIQSIMMLNQIKII